MAAPARVDPALMLRAIARYRQKEESARKYLQDFIDLTVKDELGQPITLHALQIAWCFHLVYCWNRDLHSLILAPFGSGKSSGFMVPLATWLIGRDVQTRVKFVCSSDTNAAARVESAKLLMETPEYRGIFPHVRRGAKWTNHEVIVKRQGAAIDPTLHARGIDTKGIGTRADVLLFDDVVDQENSAEELQRKKVKERFGMTWMSRLNPAKGRVLYIATPWHVDDLTHELMQTKRWCTLVHRVNADCSAFEQEVIGGGSDYADVVGAMWERYRAARAA